MAAPADFDDQIQSQRDYLLRFAAMHLRDSNAAEDAVQETLLAALAGQSGFQGRSNLRTWLTGILKHKILDAHRRSKREVSIDASLEGDGSEFDSLFRSDGHWVEHPAAWNDPDAALERKEFFAVLEDCLARLPAKTARVFLMREHLGADTDEICKEVGVTPTNCWVILYRARMALQECLSANWFLRRS
jgi:RNA polymerase sigma-70 factor (ECF subfamily)